MTRLEPHRCDICGEIFYVPEEPLRKLRLIESDGATIDYDVCFDCREAVFKWINERREKT